MYKCIFIKKKLYEYLDGSLSERDKIEVKKHMDMCISCRGEFSRMKKIIETAGTKDMPHPSDDFWHMFQAELDGKLNAQLVPPLTFRRKLLHRAKPVLVPVASVLILLVSLSAYIQGKAWLLIGQDARLIDEIGVLEEVSPETIIVSDEETYLDELNLFDQLNSNHS